MNYINKVLLSLIISLTINLNNSFAEAKTFEDLEKEYDRLLFICKERNISNKEFKKYKLLADTVVDLASSKKDEIESMAIFVEDCLSKKDVPRVEVVNENYKRVKNKIYRNETQNGISPSPLLIIPKKFESRELKVYPIKLRKKGPIVNEASKEIYKRIFRLGGYYYIDSEKKYPLHYMLGVESGFKVVLAVDESRNLINEAISKLYKSLEDFTYYGEALVSVIKTPRFFEKSIKDEKALANFPKEISFISPDLIKVKAKRLSLGIILQGIGTDVDSTEISGGGNVFVNYTTHSLKNAEKLAKESGKVTLNQNVAFAFAEDKDYQVEGDGDALGHTSPEVKLPVIAGKAPVSDTPFYIKGVGYFFDVKSDTTPGSTYFWDGKKNIIKINNFSNLKKVVAWKIKNKNLYLIMADFKSYHYTHTHLFVYDIDNKVIEEIGSTHDEDQGLH